MSLPKQKLRKPPSPSAKDIPRNEAAPGQETQHATHRADPLVHAADRPRPPRPPFTFPDTPYLETPTAPTFAGGCDQPIGPTPASAPPGETKDHVGPCHDGYDLEDYIELQGSLKPDRGHLLRINNAICIKLQWLQFVTLLVLASVARRNVGLPAPIDITDRDYLQPADIEGILARLKAGELSCAGLPWPACANSTSAQDISDAKYKLLQRLIAHRQNPGLIDPVPHAGFRLSVRPGRIRIRLVDGKGVHLWDWTE